MSLHQPMGPVQPVSLWASLPHVRMAMIQKSWSTVLATDINGELMDTFHCLQFTREIQKDEHAKQEEY